MCIFAEGDRTFNGVTGPFFTATAKLVRMTGAQLVTFRLEGGYFSSPRWSDTLRKGKFYGHEVNRYSPETLKAMSTEEIDACIARDLHEDAYARQRQSPVRYRGKRLAESLETALYFCPRCGGLGTLKSEGNPAHCTCCSRRNTRRRVSCAAWSRRRHRLRLGRLAARGTQAPP